MIIICKLHLYISVNINLIRKGFNTFDEKNTVAFLEDICVQKCL